MLPLGRRVGHCRDMKRCRCRAQRVSRLSAMQKRRFAGSSADARLVAATYRCMAQRQADRQEIEVANQALRGLLTDLGMAVVGILPGVLVSLPPLYALAR